MASPTTFRFPECEEQINSPPTNSHPIKGWVNLPKMCSASHRSLSFGLADSVTSLTVSVSNSLPCLLPLEQLTLCLPPSHLVRSQLLFRPYAKYHHSGAFLFTPCSQRGSGPCNKCVYTSSSSCHNYVFMYLSFPAILCSTS